MPDALRERYIAALVGEVVTPQQLCEACVVVLGMEHVAVISRLQSGQLEVAGASDDVAAHRADLQVTTGDGPAPEALARGGPVLVPDTARTPADRWPLFTPAAAGESGGAVYALPLHRGAIELGVLVLHRADTTPLDGAALSAILDAAETITTILLLTGGRDPIGDPVSAGVGWPQENSLSTTVHQATGMVLAQLDGTLTEAYLRMRAHAFTHDSTLTEVAQAVVDRQLRFDPDPDPSEAGVPGAS